MSSVQSVGSYRVLYAKAGVKKRKQFSDGYLHIKEGSGNSFMVTLTSEEGADLRKSSEKSISAFKVGEEAAFGSFVVQIEESVGGSKLAAASSLTASAVPATQAVATNRALPSSSVKSNSFRAPSSSFRAPTLISNRPVLPSAPVPAPSTMCVPSSSAVAEIECDHDTFWDNVNPSSQPASSSNVKGMMKVEQLEPQKKEISTLAPAKQFAPSNSGLKRKIVSHTVEQDPSLMKLMRPHQIVGANFLISRLLGETNKGDGSVPVASADDDGEQGMGAGADCTGAILADEMGVGKTLTAISVVWAFVRKGGRKTLIICPSSLVDNWMKEIKHWLGTKLKPLTLKAGADAAALINTFAISMATLYPVMVLSYEMFRKHAALLNTVPGLELIVCDEGHRLKNIGGTKTIQSLSACKAQRRVILSGTPIQNDLDELYAVVAFVAPGYLGSLSEYKSRIAQPISRGNESDATATDREEAAAASDLLRKLLGKIMLRRTQADILCNLLPPRTDYVVYCEASAAQAAEYAAVAQDIQRSLGLGSTSLEELDWDAEALESNTAGCASSVILPGLQNLRRICNMASATSTTSTSSSSSLAKLGTGAGAGGGFASAREQLLQGQKENVSNSGSVVNKSAGTLGGKGVQSVPNNTTAGRTSKLLVLACFIKNLRKLCPDEKIVVVSNFTTALDYIETLAKSRNWGAILRLDGKVPVDQRQSLVNRFNRPEDDSFLFLLSAKAGGVGINLIGASRLVMYDVDWNPAVDLQAMSRVWREGQRRPVHIYRLVMAGTIEDAILQRQRSKRDLANLVDGSDDLNATGTDESALGALGAMGAGGRKNGGEKRMSLTRKDVLQLLYPALCAQVIAPPPVTESFEEQSAETAPSSHNTTDGRCSGGGAMPNRRRGRVQCSDDEEESVLSDCAPACEPCPPWEAELQLADVMGTPSSCETYAEEPDGGDEDAAMLPGAADGADGEKWEHDTVKCEVVEKVITDEVLLTTMSQLGSAVISKAACVE